MDLAITHNSLTTNLDRLDDAHRKIAQDYPDLLPVRTTCGTVARSHGPWARARWLGRARSAANWWRESGDARAAGRIVGAPAVIADIRLVIDDAVALGGGASLRVVDATAPGGTSAAGLTRFGRPFAVDSVDAAAVPGRVADAVPDEVILLTGVQRRDVERIARAARDAGSPVIFGCWEDIGMWALVGVDASAAAPLWPGRRNRPFAGVFGRSAA
jgi:hypothetical protein